MTLAELDRQIAELEAGGRWSDAPRALEQRSTLAHSQERIATLLRLMRLYRDRFANHGLAMAAAERILEIEPEPEAVSYLRVVYRKRREHEKLALLESQLDDKTRGPFSLFDERDAEEQEHERDGERTGDRPPGAAIGRQGE